MEMMFDHSRRQAPRMEMALGLDRLRQVLPTIVGLGSGISELEQLLEVEPQRDGHGNLRYLVTSGIAVELITRFIRPHHDLDLVIMDPTNENYWEIYGTDNVTPQTYWADMKFDPSYLQQTARIAKTRPERRNSPIAEVVHPAVLLVQKSSDAFGRSPRERDRQDVRAIVRHWRGKERFTREWNPIIRYALDALPTDQLDRTLVRVREILETK